MPKMNLKQLWCTYSACGPFTKNPKYDGYQKCLPSMVYKCFDKKSVGSVVANNEINWRITQTNC